MKAGVVGLGTVGRAAALAAMQRGSAAELVLVNRNAKLAEAVALDLGYGAALSPTRTVRAGGSADLAGAGIVCVAAGGTKDRAARPTAGISRAGCGCSARTSRC
jgi:L-lactate dehydrogenase